MRSGAAAAHEGYFHETAFYDSDDQFLEIVIPFLEDGRAAAEPTVVALDHHNEALVRGALGPGPDLTFVPGGTTYARPAPTIKAYRDLLRRHVADGAAQIRVVGDVPHPGTGASWDCWA